MPKRKTYRKKRTFTKRKIHPYTKHIKDLAKKFILMFKAEDILEKPNSWATKIRRAYNADLARYLSKRMTIPEIYREMRKKYPFYFSFQIVPYLKKNNYKPYLR